MVPPRIHSVQLLLQVQLPSVIQLEQHCFVSGGRAVTDDQEVTVSLFSLIAEDFMGTDIKVGTRDNSLPLVSLCATTSQGSVLPVEQHYSGVVMGVVWHGVQVRVDAPQVCGTALPI